MKMAKSYARDILRKALLVGIGAASLTKEAAENIAKKVKKDYNLNEKEGRKLAEDILESSKKHMDAVTKEAQKHAGKLLRELDAAAKSARKAPKSASRKRKRKK